MFLCLETSQFMYQNATVRQSYHIFNQENQKIPLTQRLFSFYTGQVFVSTRNAIRYHHYRHHHHHHHQGLYSLLAEEALLGLIPQVSVLGESSPYGSKLTGGIVSSPCFWTTLFSGPKSWGSLCCSDGPTVIRQPCYVTCPSMLCFPDSVGDIAYARVLSGPGVLLSVSKGNAQNYAFRLAPYDRKLFHHSVVQRLCLKAICTGRMYWLCIFLFIFTLVLRPLMMLPALPKAAQPSAILFQKLISGSRSAKSGIVQYSIHSSGTELKQVFYTHSVEHRARAVGRKGLVN